MSSERKILAAAARKKRLTDRRPKTPRKVIDWAAVEASYSSAYQPLRTIAAGHGITEGAVRARAKRFGWTRPVDDSRSVILKTEPREMSRSGFLYVVFVHPEGSRRLCKIGMSNVFSERLGSHQTSSPYDVVVACAYFVADAYREEAELHQLFAEKRVRGEWFDLDNADLRLIADRSLLV